MLHFPPAMHPATGLAGLSKVPLDRQRHDLATFDRQITGLAEVWIN